MPGPSLDPFAVNALSRYVDLIRAASSRLDLVAPNDLGRLEQRHVADSLKALAVVDASPPGPIADVGSGAGFPGIPIAIARPARIVHLIEPRRRRAAFLEHVVRTLDLSAEVLVASAQELAGSPLRYACVLARALAPPEEALSLILPLVIENGTAAVFLGKGDLPPSGTGFEVPGVATMRRMGPQDVDK